MHIMYVPSGGGPLARDIVGNKKKNDNKRTTYCAQYYNNNNSPKDSLLY